LAIEKYAEQKTIKGIVFFILPSIGKGGGPAEENYLELGAGKKQVSLQQHLSIATLL
jgi:hypothetical protein